MGLTGYVAAVTGSASGIGEQVARTLTGHGARVVGFDLTTRAEAGFEQRELDVRDSAAVNREIDELVGRHGRLDILVASAGVGSVGGIAAADDDEWHRVLDVNVIGTARVIRAATPHLAASGRGSIVLLGSVVAHVGFPERVVYSASKGAVHALMLAAARDLIDCGVRVNAVTPGHVDTAWMGRTLAGLPDAAGARERLERRHPMPRFATAAEVADAVAFLAGPHSSFTTGSEIRVDGGLLGLTNFPQQADGDPQ